MKRIVKTAMALFCCAALLGLCACGNITTEFSGNSNDATFTQGDINVTVTINQAWSEDALDCADEAE